MNKFNNINFFKDQHGKITKIEVQKFEFLDTKPKLIHSHEIVTEQNYIVQPDNPRKLKHRNRKVKVREFLEDDIGNPERISVEFLDNKAVGIVDIYDLFPIENKVE